MFELHDFFFENISLAWIFFISLHEYFLGLFGVHESFFF